MAEHANEKSEYDLPQEKSDSLCVDEKIELHEEQDEFIHEPKQFTVYVNTLTILIIFGYVARLSLSSNLSCLSFFFVHTAVQSLSDLS